MQADLDCVQFLYLLVRRDSVANPTLRVLLVLMLNGRLRRLDEFDHSVPKPHDLRTHRGCAVLPVFATLVPRSSRAMGMLMAVLIGIIPWERSC